MVEIYFFDLDQTLVMHNMTQHFLLRYIKGFKIPLKEGIFTRLNQIFQYQIFPYKVRVIHEFIAGLLKPHYLELDALVDDFLDDFLEKSIYLPAFEELKRAIHLGKEVVILSSSPKFLVVKVAEKLGVGYAYATEYSYDKRELLITEVIDGEKKGDIARKIQNEMGMEKGQLSAYSDSIYDLKLFEAVGEPVAVNPDPALKKLAISQGWRIL